MKKMITLAFIASMVISGVTFCAEEPAKTEEVGKTEPAKTEEVGKTDAEETPKSRFSKVLDRVTSVVNVKAAQGFYKENPKTTYAVGTVAVFAVMYKTCSWFRRLIGVEEAPRKAPKVARAANPALN